jgi:NADP-dependent 3-hydroxy acid dehydrogenase YdfG
MNDTLFALQDLNFWGAVYPTYFALPYLKASRGNIVVTASVAGRVPTARMSFYNVSNVPINKSCHLDQGRGTVSINSATNVHHQ